MHWGVVQAVQSTHRFQITEYNILVAFDRVCYISLNKKYLNIKIEQFIKKKGLFSWYSVGVSHLVVRRET